MDERIYGIHPVREAIRSRARPVKEIYIQDGTPNRRLQEIVELAHGEGIKLVPMKKVILDRLSGTKNHQGVVANVGGFPYMDLKELMEDNLKEPRLFLILDGITDPHNLGALLRTGCAYGVDGIILPKRRSAPINHTVAKVSAGACEYLPIALVNNLVSAIDFMKKKGVWIVGTDEDASTKIHEIPYIMDIAIVIGSEGMGMRSLVRKKCDYIVSIPCTGKIRSLNASVAGAVVVYEILRKRLEGSKEI